MFHDGAYIRITDDDQVWLKFYADYSDPDEHDSPASIEPCDLEFLGWADDRLGIDRTLRRAKFDLLLCVEQELEQALESWKEETDSHEPVSHARPLALSGH